MNIEKRQNISRDGELRVVACDKLTGYNANFKIQSGSKGILNQDNPDSMFYLDPYILTSNDLKSILTNESKDSKFEVLKAYSVIVHELTHYYQKGEFAYIHGNKYIKYNESNDKEYVSQLSELDAHAVQSYFFVKNINPKGLEKILSHSSVQVIKERLINEYRLYNSQTKLYE
ncbi:MAG: hypothetical protein Q8T04_00255 [Bacteroidota bacterium]|nr:hypothetical protein [Bacteroidota bacterium]